MRGHFFLSTLKCWVPVLLSEISWLLHTKIEIKTQLNGGFFPQVHVDIVVYDRLKGHINFKIELPL